LKKDVDKETQKITKAGEKQDKDKDSKSKDASKAKEDQ